MDCGCCSIGMSQPSSTFFAEAGKVTAGDIVSLSEREAHHIRVLRLKEGEIVGLRDGVGSVGHGKLLRIAKSGAEVEVEAVEEAEAPYPIHLLVPVADRERMLWLAEKAVELNIASWRPVLWSRSRSVSPRGEGDAFRTKVRARMVSALLQSRSAWLPEIFPEESLSAVLRDLPTEAERLMLIADGQSMLNLKINRQIILALGPEGGFEPEEVASLRDSGFKDVTLGPSVLRFETAGLAGIAVARSMLL